MGQYKRSRVYTVTIIVDSLHHYMKWVNIRDHVYIYSLNNS